MFMRKDIFDIIEKMVNGETVSNEETLELQTWVRGQGKKAIELEAERNNKAERLYNYLFNDVKTILKASSKPMTHREIIKALETRFHNESEMHPEKIDRYQWGWYAKREGRVMYGLNNMWNDKIIIHKNGRNANTYSLKEGV